MELREYCPIELPEGLDLPGDVVLGARAGSAVAELIGTHVGDRALWIADPATWEAVASLDVTRSVDDDDLALLALDAHADDANVARVLREATRRDATGLVAVGSGTVNDVAKLAATRAGVPYLVVGTAASMNGYASGIAAILSDGLKTTVAARPPRAIVLDSGILAAAPPALGQAGLGDLISKPVSTADWWLGHRLDGDSFDELPGRIVESAVAAAAAAASGIPRRDPQAFETLARALVLSGVSMVVAGKSSPASGGEHLISHLWDMEALAEGRPLRLHGAQVGVATAITAALYDRLLAFDRPAFPPPPSWHDEARRIAREHRALARIVIAPAERKHARTFARRTALRGSWDRLRDELRALAIPRPSEILAVLAAAQAPASLAELGVSPDDARRALLSARDIRDRFTVLDLAFECGYFPAHVDEVLAAAGV